MPLQGVWTVLLGTNANGCLDGGDEDLSVADAVGACAGDDGGDDGLDLVGLAGGPVRPPRVDVSPEGRAEIRAALEILGVEMTNT